MSRRSLFLFILCATTLFSQTSPPQIRFDADVNFLKLPRDLYLGEVAGVAVNAQRHIFVFSRGNSTGPAYGATAAQLLEFGAQGQFIREIGKNLYAWSYAHAVKIDKNGNIWAIDKGSDMVIKFNAQGRVIMVFGRKKEASDEASPWTKVTPPRPALNGQFRQPTDVTWDKQGNISVSDGYVNSRVAKFDATGNWLKQFGGPGSNPGEFNTPHSLATDNEGNIYVGDRGNRRIQIFNSEGEYLREIKIDVSVPDDAKSWMGDRPGPNSPLSMQSGAPWAICITPGAKQFLYAADGFPGRIYKLSLSGEVLGVLGSSGHMPKQFGWIHEMACPSENELYVAEILNWRVQKLNLHPGK